MKLKPMKLDVLRYAKSWCFSENYAVFCTGRTALICDKRFTLLHTITGLAYTYRAIVSPDEKTLLLISISNCFYLFDFETQTLKKQVIRGQYSSNLEGRGCWSFDGQALLFPVYDGKTGYSALRRYDASDLSVHTDLMEGAYYFAHILSIKSWGKYVLLGVNREKADQDRKDDCCLLFFDGATFEECPIPELHEDSSLDSLDYDPVTDTVVVYGFETTMRYGRDGKAAVVSLPEQTVRTASLSNAFADLESADKLDTLKALFQNVGLEDMQMADSITKLAVSADATKLYIASHTGFYICDAITGKILAKKSVDYGVQDIRELTPTTLAIATWGGVKAFEMVE